MRLPAILLLYIFSVLAIWLTSCTTKCDCGIDASNMISDLDVKKSIIQVNSANFATGFETVFSKTTSKASNRHDSAYQAQMCQSVINKVRFFDDESGYFFVESYNAWMVAHATKPDFIGTYRYNIQDIHGKYYVRDMVEAIVYKGFGFVEYYFDHTETGVATKKLSFVKSIPEAEFFIGTGFYNYNPNWYYTSDEVALGIV